MALMRLTRFTIDAADREPMLTKRAALIDAVRARYPGLTETRLTRIDDEHWLDLWRWESDDHLQAVVAGVHDLPEATPAFALVRDATAESADIIEER